MRNFIKNLKFSSVIDFLFFNLTLFLIFFAWTRFIFKNVLIALIITFALIIAINIIKNIRMHIKSSKNATLKIKSSEMENCLLLLLAQSNQEKVDLFSSFYEKNEIECVLDNIIVFKDNSGLAINFSHKNESQESFLRIVYKARQNNIKKLSILCYSMNKQDKIFFENLTDIEAKILEKEEVYTKFLIKLPKKENYFNVKSTGKIKFKQFISLSIDRRKAKGYFLSGLLIFFCSLIVKYNIYYVIMSSILFLLALLSFRKNETLTIQK